MALHWAKTVISQIPQTEIAVERGSFEFELITQITRLCLQLYVTNENREEWGNNILNASSRDEFILSSVNYNKWMRNINDLEEIES